jgi:hypothetical protein
MTKKEFKRLKKVIKLTNESIASVIEFKKLNNEKRTFREGAITRQPSPAQLANETIFKSFLPNSASLSPNAVTERTFSRLEIERLQNSIHKITGDGEVMMIFNEFLGISSISLKK